MAGVTNIAYVHIIAVAAIPAVLYVLTCGAYTEFQARRMRIARFHQEVDRRVLLNRFPLFLISFVVIITLGKVGFFRRACIDPSSANTSDDASFRHFRHSSACSGLPQAS